MGSEAAACIARWNRRSLSMEADEKLNCTGLMCPMPIVELTKKVRAMGPGKVLATRGSSPTCPRGACAPATSTSDTSARAMSSPAS
jgi:hypothetical protein